MEFTLDEDMVESYVESVAQKYDSFGKSWTFKSTIRDTGKPEWRTAETDFSDTCCEVDLAAQYVYENIDYDTPVFMYW